jgi:D-glycerate 3-kinase
MLDLLCKPDATCYPDFFPQVSIIKHTLENHPYNLPTVVCSIDDLYLSHADQVNLAKAHPDNPLLQHRGQPSTHDTPLAKLVFSSLRQNSRTGIPRYNKAAFNGQGDRVPEDQWDVVNVEGQDTVRVVLFEGWCVGFRPLSEHDLKQKYASAVKAREGGHYLGRLGHNGLESIIFINNALKEYDHITK